MFRVWQCGVGHSQLLVSSRTGRDSVDYIDVLFEAVEFMQLWRVYHGLVLEETSAPEAGLGDIDLPNIPLLTPVSLVARLPASSSAPE